MHQPFALFYSAQSRVGDSSFDCLWWRIRVLWGRLIDPSSVVGLHHSWLLDLFGISRRAPGTLLVLLPCVFWHIFCRQGCRQFLCRSIWWWPSGSSRYILYPNHAFATIIPCSILHLSRRGYISLVIGPTLTQKSALVKRTRRMPPCRCYDLLPTSCRVMKLIM